MFFIRLVTPSLWAQLLQEPPSVEALETIVNRIMGDMPMSVYRVGSDDELHVVAVAMSINRDKDRNLDFVRITDEDLGDLRERFCPKYLEDGTPVEAANRLHWEADLQPDEVRSLVLRIRDRGLKEQRQRLTEVIKGKHLRTLAKDLNVRLGLNLPDCWLLR